MREKASIERRPRLRDRLLAPAVVGTAALVVAGCGGTETQDANEPAGTYSVDVVEASFPSSQRLAQRSQMRIVVRNAGPQAVPNVAVTVEPPTAPGRPRPDAFAAASDDERLADASRPIWIVDAGPAGGFTAYTNTWALGRLAPGASKTFTWRVTAVKPGNHVLRWTVSAGLDGKAKAQLPGGGRPTGEFQIDISDEPADGRLGPGDQPVVVPR